MGGNRHTADLGGCAADELLVNLAEARGYLHAAQYNALIATFELPGERQARAEELTRLIADCRAYAERLAFVVLGDYQMQR